MLDKIKSSDKIKEALYNKFNKVIDEVNSLLDNSQKTKIVISETLPDISEREKGTIYLRLADTPSYPDLPSMNNLGMVFDNGTPPNAKISPVMNLKIVRE